jgi:hypothetical protein
VACVATSTSETNLSNNCDDEETNIPGGSPTPTALPATSTPKGLPVTGGLPGPDSPGGRLVLIFGIGLIVAGVFAAAYGRRKSLAD